MMAETVESKLFWYRLQRKKYSMANFKICIIYIQRTSTFILNGPFQFLNNLNQKTGFVWLKCSETCRFTKKIKSSFSMHVTNWDRNIAHVHIYRTGVTGNDFVKVKIIRIHFVTNINKLTIKYKYKSLISIFQIWIMKWISS